MSSSPLWGLDSALQHEPSHSGSSPSSCLQRCIPHLSHVLVFMKTPPHKDEAPEDESCLVFTPFPTHHPAHLCAQLLHLPSLSQAGPPALCSGPSPSCSLKDLAPVNSHIVKRFSTDSQAIVSSLGWTLILRLLPSYKGSLERQTCTQNTM